MSFFFRQRPSLELPVLYAALDKSEMLMVKEEYMLRQKDLCYYCHSSLRQPPPQDVTEKPVTKRLYPEGFFDRPIHLHHDHNTGMTIGVVHAYCNAVLWEYFNE